MLKKSLMLILLAFATATAYAYAPTEMDVQEDMINKSFSMDAIQWGYQFYIPANKTMTFVITVDESSEGVVNLQCWHGSNPVENYFIKPGQTSTPCVTNDTVRIVTGSAKDLPATGTYSITESK